MAARYNITFTITNNLAEPLTKVGESLILDSGAVTGGHVATVLTSTTSRDIVFATNNAAVGVNGNLTYKTSLDGRIGFVTFIFKSNTAGQFAAIISDNDAIDVKYERIGHGTPLKIAYTVG